jgi:hypothetical protein
MLRAKNKAHSRIADFRLTEKGVAVYSFHYPLLNPKLVLNECEGSGFKLLPVA